MATLPAAASFTGSSVTEGQFKTAITDQRDFLADLLGTDSANKVAALTALGAILNVGSSKSGAYTVVAADKGKVIRATGTWTLSLTAAATLADGFAFAVLNEGAGTITIDPNASELIDGAATKALAANQLAIVYCNGAAFTTVGAVTLKAPTTQAFTANGTWSKPTGCTAVYFEAWGGGGGGGGASGVNVSGFGGLAGACASTFIVSPAASYSVTIGAGGTNAAAGGSTTVGAVLTAAGGGSATAFFSIPGNGGQQGQAGRLAGGAGRTSTSGGVGTSAAANSGAGGGGAFDQNGNGFAGSNGGSGYVLAVEFY